MISHCFPFLSSLFIFCYSISYLCIFHYFFLKCVHTSLLLSCVSVSCVTFQAFVSSISNVYIFRAYPSLCLSMCVCLLHILILKPMYLSLLLSQVCVSFITSVSSLCLYPLSLLNKHVHIFNLYLKSIYPLLLLSLVCVPLVTSFAKMCIILCFYLKWVYHVLLLSQKCAYFVTSILTIGIICCFSSKFVYISLPLFQFSVLVYMHSFFLSVFPFSYA